jgi:hypothetical protein
MHHDRLHPPAATVGRHVGSIERIELELLHRITDVGVQALARGARAHGSRRRTPSSRRSF